MGKKFMPVLQIGAVYLGTVLGAGFATGQELTLFFVRFSRRGLLGCVLAGILFCFLGAVVLAKSNQLPEKSLKAYLKSLFPRSMATCLVVVTEVFLCISFCIMLSGVGAFFKERFGVAPIWGILLTDVICLLVFLADLQGVSGVNIVLTPLMLLGTVYISVFSIITESRAAFLPAINDHAKFLPYALFYVGYNMLTATAVLVPLSALAKNPTEAKKGGILGGACLLFMAFLCCLALYFGQKSSHDALPMLALSQRAGRFAYFSYSCVLFMAMLTTAVSAGFSILQNLCRLGLGQKRGAFLIFFFALPLSFVEFSVLMKNTYIFFGVLGITLVGGIILDWYKRKQKTEKIRENVSK